MDDGRLTDSQGRTVDFRNTILVLTSNLGSEHILDAQGRIDDEVKNQVFTRVKQQFRPEFLNRIDEQLVFNSLDPDALKKISYLQVEEVSQRLGKRELGLEVSPEALAHLVQMGTDLVYGARPLKRAIQRELIDPLAEQLIASPPPPGSNITVTYVDDALKIEIQPAS
jgi:ATP-dependent Clp protease ATP-binding subunit ClpB